MFIQPLLLLQVGLVGSLDSSKGYIEGQLDRFSIIANVLKATTNPNLRSSPEAASSEQPAASPANMDELMTDLRKSESAVSAVAQQSKPQPEAELVVKSSEAILEPQTATRVSEETAPKHLEEGEESGSSWTILLIVVGFIFLCGAGYVYYRYTQWIPRARSPSAKTGYRALAQAKTEASGSTDEAATPSQRASISATDGADTASPEGQSPRTSKYKARRAENLPAAP